MSLTHSGLALKRVPCRANRRKIILGFNLALGVILWFGYCTDYSWAGTIPDYFYPPFVALIALVSLIFHKRYINPRFSKLALMPSLLGGGIFLALGLIMVIPPFTLGVLFGLAEVKQEKLIQTVVSPSGWQVAKVYFRPIGAYGRGNGRISVRVGYRWLPIVERDLFYHGRSYATEKTREYIRWQDEDTLLILGEPGSQPQKIKVGTIRFMMPEIIALPFKMIKAWQSISSLRLQESRPPVPSLSGKGGFKISASDTFSFLAR